MNGEKPSSTDFFPADAADKAPQSPRISLYSTPLNVPGSSSMNLLNVENGNSAGAAGDQNPTPKTEDETSGAEGSKFVLSVGEILSTTGRRVVNAFDGLRRGIANATLPVLDVIAAL